MFAAVTSARAADFDKDVQPLLAAYCYDCHNPTKPKGDLDLTKFKDAASAAASPEVWDDVVRRLADKEMPPAKSKQPPPADVERMHLGLKSLAKADLDCTKFDDALKSDKGYVTSRRLNKAEYNNTLRDLIGFDLKPGDDLPADGAGGEGFDTVGDALFTSAIHIEKYLDAADHALDAVLVDTKPIGERFGVDALKGAQSRILVAKPGSGITPREAAAKVVAEFARRAWRRPPAAGEAERYLKLFDRASARGDSFERAIKLSLQGILVSPSFLFLVEPEADAEGVHALGDFPLASRLSYFLWATMPDEELFKLAADGKLHDDAVLRQQVRRMIKDPMSAGMAERFTMQWLELEKVGVTSKPDATRFPQFTDKLADAMKSEAVLLFDRVVREDRPLVQLIDADYTFVNEDLAKLYNLPDVKGQEMRPVSLPDRNRGGVLGLAAVHVATSFPLRTSPVLRGKWVLGELLGSKVPPPPPGAGELPADDKAASKLSFRQQLEVHRQRSECASCHARMDPLGFGMENFDAIGRWRTSDAAGQPVDSSGELPGGQKFNGPAELKQVLLKRQAEFDENLCRKLLGYALGRELKANGRRPGQVDQCVVDDCLKAMKDNDGKPGAVFETIVLSKPFRQRYTKK